MRIPLTEADWPTEFNDVSKFLGRHWPAGKLKLNQARETTAFLFGYNSAHDAKQELQHQLSPAGKSVSDYVQSMSLRALVKFQLNPLTTRKLFSDLPWRKLSCWKSTTDFQLEALLKRRTDETQYPIIFDEFGQFENYKSPVILVKMIDDGRLPNKEYAVNFARQMYRRSTIETLLENLTISPDELTELAFNGTLEDFINEYIEPLAWQPIEAQLKDDVDVRSKATWQAPFLRRVDSVEGGYRIFHEGYQAYYAPFFAAEEDLVKALTSLYQGDSISKSGLSTGELLINEEYFHRSDIDQFCEYAPLMIMPWLSKQAWPEASPETVVDRAALSTSIQKDHERIERWIESVKGHSYELLKNIDDGGISEALASVIRDETFSLEKLQSEDEFTPATYEGCSEEYAANSIAECKNRIQEATELGQRILEYHPELLPYYDPVAACSTYQEFCGNTRDWFYSCYKREPSFLAFVFGLACQRRFGQGRENLQFMAELILIDAANQTLAMNNIGGAWENINALLSLHAKQEPKIQKMRKWAKYSSTMSSDYLTHGENAKVIRKSHGEVISQLYRSGRRYASKVEFVIQDLQDHTKP